MNCKFTLGQDRLLRTFGKKVSESISDNVLTKNLGGGNLAHVFHPFIRFIRDINTESCTKEMLTLELSKAEGSNLEEIQVTLRLRTRAECMLRQQTSDHHSRSA